MMPMHVAVSRVHRARLACAALACAVAPAVAQDAARRDELAVTFLANEGVLLSSAGGTVLIDGLFQPYERYAVPADSTQRALAGARPPFHAVDLILVTHHHGDHFHPAPVAAHLRANPRARLVASTQVLDSLRGRVQGDARIASRLVARTMPVGTRRREVIDGIPVELLGLSHGTGRHRRVQHLGYVVELAGRRVLHAGDAVFTERNFAPFRLDTARIDVALLPMWAVTSEEGRRVIARWIRPRQVVAFHVMEGGGARAVREARAALPGTIVFARSLERRVVR